MIDTWCFNIFPPATESFTCDVATCFCKLYAVKKGWISSNPSIAINFITQENYLFPKLIKQPSGNKDGSCEDLLGIDFSDERESLKFFRFDKAERYPEARGVSVDNNNLSSS